VTDRFTAIVRGVPSSLAAGERSFIGRDAIDIGNARRQHQAYVGVLRDLGADVVEIPADDEHPDCVFIEDAAIVLDELAVVTMPGADSRRGEIEPVAAELAAFRPVHRIALPATIDGGDVAHAGRTLFVGASQRTNAEGIDALRRLVEPHGYDVRAVRLTGCLHLKSACAPLPDGRLLINPEWFVVGDVAGHETVRVHAAEAWAANVTVAGGAVIAAAEMTRTNAMLQREGYDVRSTPLSEFAKAEGGATCLSLVVGRDVSLRSG
jgi:dimethylargininase